MGFHFGRVNTFSQMCFLTYEPTNQSTDSREVSPSEAFSCPTTQGLPNILWNLKIHHHVLFILLFIYDLFNNAVSSSDYTASNDGMTSK
jgi:hypothetical protein